MYSRAILYDDLQASVDALMSHREADDLEFKSAKGGFPGSFWETYSAFANSEGGLIVLGVKEKEGQFFLDGLKKEDVEKYQRNFWSAVNNPNKVSAKLLMRDDVRELEVDGKYLLVFYVPRASRERRPVYVGVDPYRGTYRRYDEGDYLCDRTEVSNMFADANVHAPADGRILDGFTLEDIDMPSLRQYRQLFRMSHPDHVWHSLDDEAFLEKINAYRRDRSSGKKGFTVAGLLMFGKYAAITDPACVPHFFPEFRDIPLDNSNTRWLNRIYPNGEWEANLLQFYLKVLPILQGGLPTPFRLENDMRIDSTAAHVAIREALVNLCIHASYASMTSLVVSRTPSQIVFTNPGSLLISQREFYEGGVSVCRNSYLQTMFMLLGNAEKAGSGVDKIMKGWRELNLRVPYVRQLQNPSRTELVMPLSSLIDEKIKQYLAKLFGSQVEDLDEKEYLTLALACSEEEISNERLCSVLGMHKHDITLMLGKLCKGRFLRPFGYGRGRTYRLLTENGANVATSEANVATSEANVATSDANVATSDANVATSLPKKMSKKAFGEELVRFCEEWRTLNDIVLHFGRTKKYIKNRLPLYMNLLERRFPDIPNHPGQKYRSKRNEEDKEKIK